MEPQLPKPQLPNIERAPVTPPEQLPDSLEEGMLQETKEKSLINPELDTSQPMPVQTPQQATDDQAGQVVPQTPVTQPFNPATQTGAPLVAGDEDVIEREWVDKAKQIVEKTKSDPRMQKHEVSSLQADYIKKRYGKVIKTPDES